MFLRRRSVIVMSRNFRMKFALSLVIMAVMCLDACAKSGQEHAQLWNNVFGVTDWTSKENMMPLWRTAQEVIDETGSDYKDLQARFEWFTWGHYGHRLLFHWGFNADPKRYAPLVKQVRSCLKGRPDASEQERKFFAYLATNIQSRRN